MTEPLVIDASAALYLAAQPGGLERYAKRELVAPALLWSETFSAMREAIWRSQLSGDLAVTMRSALIGAPIRAWADRDLYQKAWSIAERLGWAKTYDAEYIALAELLGAPLLTADARLSRGATRIVPTVSPMEAET